MQIVIVKYNAGNIQSVLYALERMGVEAVVTDDFEAIEKADKIIFPGVGEASSAMQYLKEKGLDKVLKNCTQPFLGICLGMQLMCRHSEENQTHCLDIFDLEVKKFVAPAAQSFLYKIPQMGWNTIENLKSPLFKGISTPAYCYFVHSYYVPKNAVTIAETDYTLAFSAAIQKDNFFGVQFHPEKSGTVGEKILQNFIAL